jgi:hypothetical protein
MTEMFRISPEVGKCYETAEYTSTTGKWPNNRYFTTNPVRYVGEFVRHVSEGYRDNASHTDIFLLDGKEVFVHYTYEGTTCFREKN